MVEELNAIWREITHCGFPSSVVQQWKWKFHIATYRQDFRAHMIDWAYSDFLTSGDWRGSQSKEYFPAITSARENFWWFFCCFATKVSVMSHNWKLWWRIMMLSVITLLGPQRTTVRACSRLVRHKRLLQDPWDAQKKPWSSQENALKATFKISLSWGYFFIICKKTQVPVSSFV